MNWIKRKNTGASDPNVRRYRAEQDITHRNTDKLSHAAHSSAQPGVTERVPPEPPRTSATPGTLSSLDPPPASLAIEADSLDAEHVMASIVVDGSICDYAGVRLADVRVENHGHLEDAPLHPALIRRARLESDPPDPNHAKAHLVSWKAPIIDQGDILTLDLVKSDYWTSEATQACAPILQEMIEQRRLEYMTLPRRLDVHLVVLIENDSKVLLTRRSPHVSTQPSTWMVSVGESTDWNRDIRGEAPHPAATAAHCLLGRDELNLTPDMTRDARHNLVAVCTEWDAFLANLIVVTRLPSLTFPEVKKQFRRGENETVDYFHLKDMDRAERIIQEGIYTDPQPYISDTTRRVSDISRVALWCTYAHMQETGAL